MKKLTREVLCRSKWRVTPEQSKRLQELAFELGFKWISETIIKELDKPYLFFKFDKFTRQDSITYVSENSEQFFIDYKSTERKFEDYFEENDSVFIDEAENITEETWDEAKKIIHEVVENVSIINSERKEDAIKEFAKRFMEIEEHSDSWEIKLRHPEGTFMWAVNQMKQGKKVRRNFWAEKSLYIKLIDDAGNNFTYASGIIYSAGLDSIEATDWEIYEENKFVGEYFEFNVNESGYINQLRDGKYVNHQWQNQDIEAFEKAIIRARELNK